jgi:membrane associated rhomboid family serine protease
VYLVNQASTLGYHDLGAVIGPLGGDWWRLIAAQFNYDNVGYLFAVAVAVAIFGTSLERRYSALASAGIFLACGALGIYLATQIESFPTVIGGCGSALGLIGAWFVRDQRDRRAGYDTESDLLGVAAITAVLVAMPLLDTWADGWAGLGGAALGCLVGAVLPERR